MPEKTIGEQRVRTDFNVSGSSTVDVIKQKSAELINLCETLKSQDARLAALAQTSYEEAAMWAVKAATVPAVIKTDDSAGSNPPGNGQPGKP